METRKQRRHATDDWIIIIRIRMALDIDSEWHNQSRVRTMKEKNICKNCTVKRKGHIEEFDERKVYSSCYAACLTAGVPHMDAEKICDKVAVEIKKWIKGKNLITSDQIFKKTVQEIKKHHEKAAYMYETHRDLS